VLNLALVLKKSTGIAPTQVMYYRDVCTVCQGQTKVCMKYDPPLQKIDVLPATRRY
jgi:hypothetical protein